MCVKCGGRSHYEESPVRTANLHKYMIASTYRRLLFFRSVQGAEREIFCPKDAVNTPCDGRPFSGVRPLNEAASRASRSGPLRVNRQLLSFV